MLCVSVASGRTNQVLRQLLHDKKTGLVTQEFKTKRQTATAAKNAALRREAEESDAKVSSRSYAHGRKETTVTTPSSKTLRASREGTPNHDHEKHCPHHHHTPPKSPNSSGRNTPQGRTSNPTTPVRRANKAGSAARSTATPRQTATSASPRHTAAKTGSGSRGGTTPAAGSSATRQKVASTPRTGTGETAAAGAKRPTTPSGTSGLRVGTPSGQRGSRIPTPKTSKIPTKH